AGRELLLYFGDLLPDALDDLARVLALAHQDDRLDQVVFVVLAEHPEADGGPDPDRSDVAHAHRRALLGRHHDVLDVARGLHQADPAHHQRVFAATKIAAPGVRVIRGDGIEDLLERQLVSAQPLRVERDLVLLDAAAPGHDVRHARDLFELAL